MKSFLIRFTYDHYTRSSYDHYIRGFEDVEETVLVNARYFVTACAKIKSRYLNARDFKDLTIG